MERLLKKCQIRSQLVRECLAECLGVYVLILFGCGSVAQVVTTRDTKGQYLSINLGFALGVTFGVFVSRGVSGAHLNPAVSLSLCVLGKHPWKKLPFYTFFQVLGAFLAAATVCLQRHPDVQRREAGGDGSQRHRRDLLHLPGRLPERVGGHRGPGDRHGGAAAVRSGAGGPQEHPRPRRPAAGPGGGGRAGHRHLHGQQQRLRPEPRPGLRAPAVHLHRRLGAGRVQGRRRLVVGAHRGPLPGGPAGLPGVPADGGGAPPASPGGAAGRPPGGRGGESRRGDGVTGSRRRGKRKRTEVSLKV
ncbi:aquaporin-10b isoform X3 [Salarias fasciatus]|uniref:aquaporin-10b isoform X3 n=1 Tax=Salarias fasciatus TaxID=181472 RepID=UPI001176B244|nr:translation initiation factor IF-2-like isoform X3 [Salarias fasciatus]